MPKYFDEKKLRQSLKIEILFLKFSTREENPSTLLHSQKYPTSSSHTEFMNILRHVSLFLLYDAGLFLLTNMPESAS
jgi:hypothetical protein